MEMESRLVVTRVWGEGNETSNKTRTVSVWGEEQLPELDDGYTTARMYLTPVDRTLKNG